MGYKKLKNILPFLKKDKESDNQNSLSNNNKDEFPLGLDFFSFFIHELKSPLMALKFKLSQLKIHVNKKEGKEFLYQMDKDISLLFRFIHDALEMKEVENKISLNLTWISLNEVLLKNKIKLDEWAYNNQIQMKIVNPYEDIYVKVDSRWIDSVLTNLIINAIQYSPLKGKIEITVKELENHCLQISVDDEGSGIQEKDKNKIFNKFQSSRVSWPHSVLKGTGLGLYISKAIVEGHGGSIGLQSREKGCSFFFVLPQAKNFKMKKIS